MYSLNYNFEEIFRYYCIKFIMLYENSNFFIYLQAVFLNVLDIITNIKYQIYGLFKLE